MDIAIDVSWEAVIVTFVGMVPRQILYYYMAIRLLDVPHPRRTFIGCALLSLTLVAGSTPLPISWRLVGLIALCSPPFILARDRLPQKAFIAVAMVIIFILGNTADALLWYAFAGGGPTPSAIDANAPLFAAVLVSDLVVLEILFIGFVHFANKYLRPEVKRYSGEGAKHFVLFPLLQLPLLGAVLLCAFRVSVRWSLGFAVLVFALGLLCLGADLVLFHFVEQFALERIEAARVEALNRRLDAELGRYRELALVLENSAQLRHDLRNQTQVVSALAERGEFSRARECVGELLQEIERIDEAERTVLPADPVEPAEEGAR